MRNSPTFPGLEAGSRLDQKTFHKRYCATPEDFRAELIEGMVVIPSRSTISHGTFRAALVACLGIYETATPGTNGVGPVTLILGAESEPQSDGSLYILPELGGQCRIVDEYLAGPPELLVETASSSEAHELHGKYRDYEKAGVLEYVVILLREQAVRWFVRRNDQFESLTPDSAGVFRSLVFPGLWLDSGALLRDDGAALMATLQQGLQSAEHTAFVSQLKERASKHPQPE